MGTKAGPGSVLYTEDENAKLEESINKILEQRKSSSRKKIEQETTVKQQVLILHYSGILETFKDIPKTKLAKLLSALLNHNEKNIYDAMSEVNGKVEKVELYTIENLKYILPFFDEKIHIEAIRDIREDLTKLEKHENSKGK